MSIEVPRVELPVDASSSAPPPSTALPERHFEPAFDQIGSNRLQNILEMDLPRPKALLSHRGSYDIGQGAIAGTVFFSFVAFFVLRPVDRWGRSPRWLAPLGRVKLHSSEGEGREGRGRNYVWLPGGFSLLNHEHTESASFISFSSLLLE